MGDHCRLPESPTIVATDGSDVRVLLANGQASTAHFEFAAGATGVAIRHRTVDEIWHFVSGTGRVWMSGGPLEGVAIAPGSTIAIPAGEAFQVRADTGAPLVAFGVTTPPWPGDGEAEVVEGPWAPTLDSGPRP